MRLQYTEQFSTSSLTAGSTTSFGLNYWSGREPGYGSVLYDLYKYAQIHRVDYIFRVSSSVLAPFQTVLVPAPYGASATFDVLRAYRGRKLQESSGVNSMNRIQTRASYYPSRVEGIPTMFDKTTWYTKANQGAPSPLDPNSHAVWFGVGPIDTSTVGSYLVQVEISYHMHYFSPVNTVLELNQAETDFYDYREPSPVLTCEPSPALNPSRQTSHLNTPKMLKRV